MCGHVGVAGNLNSRHEKVLKTLLILDSLRGIDGTGLASVPKNPHDPIIVAKQVGNPFELFDYAPFNKIMARGNRVLIGHNRYATQGKVNRKNSHPFEFDGLVGAHNGTLTNKWKLDDAKDFDVDSENLYHHINKRGLKDALKIIEGAWALVWWDKDDQTLNFLRNKERPLYLCTAEGDALFWASESWMLDIAIAREGLKREEIIELPVDKHFTFEVSQAGKMEKPHVANAPSLSVPFVYVGNQGGYRNGYTPPSVTKPTTPAPAPAPVSNVVSIGGTAEKQNSGADHVHSSPPAQSPGVINASTYSKSQKVSLEVIGRDTDHKGSDYYICHDAQKEWVKIRLYINRRDKVELMNKFIEAEMHQFPYSDRKGIYFKVEHSTVKLKNITVAYEEPWDDEQTFEDSRGRALSRANWLKVHGNCAWCHANISPEESHFFHNDDILCDVCEEDTDVKSYVG